MASVDSMYAVELGFAPASHAFPDAERPPLLRARTRGATPYGDEGVELQICEAIDMAQDDTVRPDLFSFGFDQVDLVEHDSIQAVLTEIRDAGQISDVAALELRAALDGVVLRCSSGKQLTVLFVADEGLIMRHGRPNRLSPGGQGSKGMNGHGPAVAVHCDQDVHGTPMRQLMDGRAPELFRHDSPDGHNHDAPLMVVNLWIPLHQITQPLVLADGRSFDRLSHQLRYGLATDSFLDRDEDQTVNDIWAFLHDPGQRWYLSSEMDHRSAYVFNTLSTPHASASLPGEDVAERFYLALEAAEGAIVAGDVARLREVLAGAEGIDVPGRTTPALGRAIAEMVALVAEANDDPEGICRAASAEWSARSKRARGRVVRTSLELRIVVSVAD
ncbi:MAG: hypothetical protein GX643_10360 [Acidimicrobiales bacterium]|nr:hypothetical protein [Acidimicrobiales bacterium]